MSELNRDLLGKFLDDAKAMAIAAGEVLNHFYGNLRAIEEKETPGDLVTEADRASEEVILRAIQKNHPSHAILSEEAGKKEVVGAEWTWVVDPLDGTTNYAHQFPLFSVSIALAFRGEPVVGVVYNPLYGEMFQAVQGGGVLFNEKSGSVSSICSLDKSLLATGFAYDRRQAEKTNYPEFCHLTQKTQGVRRGGSAALDLAYVAVGRLDGFWERALHPWDTAAGVLFVREAGGRVSTMEGDPYHIEAPTVLASNGLIHEDMVQQLHLVQEKQLSF